MASTKPIQHGMIDAGISGPSDLARRIGMPISTMYYRFNHPETFTLGEIQRIVEVTHMDNSLLCQVLGGKSHA